MQKIKVGDEVIVRAGSYKGTRGKVLKVLTATNKVLVEGVNLAKKHVKPNPNANEPGGIKEKAMPIHKSNVGLYDTTAKKASRVGIRVEDGKKVRYLKASNNLVDA